MEGQVKESFHYRIQNIRNELNKTKLKKSGKNKFSNYDYFELGDFTPQADKLFLENRIMPWFELKIVQTMVSKMELPEEEKGLFEYKYTECEYARLTLYDMDSDKVLISECKTVEFDTKGTTAIQAAGAKRTYYRRYLYIDALNLAESDGVDASDNTGKPEEKIPVKSAKPKVEEKPVEEKPAPTEIKEEDALLSLESKKELSAYIKAKGGSASITDVLKKVADQLGTSREWFKEDQKQQIMNTIDALDSIGDLEGGKENE